MSSHSQGTTLEFSLPGAFARDVARRAKLVLARPGETRYADRAQWLRAAGFFALGFVAYATLLAGSFSLSGSAALIALASLCAFMLVVQLGHDASHGSVSPHRLINRLTVFFVFAILGIDGALWRDRHIRLHHQVANLPGTGIDADSIAFLRLAPDKPWRWWHRLQPLYAPFVYLVGHLHLVWVEDAQNLLKMRAEGRREFLGCLPWLQFAAGKAIHAALFLILPWALLRPGSAMLLRGYLWASALMTSSFVLLVVGTHISDFADFPQPEQGGGLSHDWATHQVLTSVDWSPTSRLAAFLSGGANGHVAHHLFPGFSHRHMAELSQIVADATKAHGLPHHVTSFAGMTSGHWRHLLTMSRPPRGHHAGFTCSSFANG